MVSISIVGDNVFCKQIAQMLPQDADVQTTRGVAPSEGADLVISNYPIQKTDAPLILVAPAESSAENLEECGASVTFVAGDFSQEAFQRCIRSFLKLIERANDISAKAEAAQHYIQNIEASNLEYHTALAGASETQAQIMQEATFPKGFDASIFYEPAASVSGDFFFAETMGSKIYAMIGDIPSHGYFAGIYGTAIYTLSKAYLRTKPISDITLLSWAKWVQRNKNVFPPPKDMHLFAQTSPTALFVEIDMVYHTARFVSCGHTGEAPIHIFANGKAEVVQMRQTCLPLGDKWPDASAPTVETEIPFAPGHAILLYTDGVTETFCAKEEDVAAIYSQERLLASISHEAGKGSWTAKSIVQSVIKDVGAFSISTTKKTPARGQELSESSDDITIACIAWKEEAQ